MMVRSPGLGALRTYLLGTLNCRGLMIASMLPLKTFDSYVEKTQPVLNGHPHEVRRGLRAWLFGDHPRVHQAVSIRDLDPETIEQLDPRAKRLFVEQMYDVADDVYAGRLQGLREIQTGGFDLEPLERFTDQVDREQEYLNSIRSALLMRPRQGFTHAHMISSFSQSIAHSRNVVDGVLIDVEAGRKESAAEDIERLAGASMLKNEVYDGKGFEVSFARNELARHISAGLQVYSSDSCWNGKVFEMRLPRDGKLLGAYWSSVSWWPPSPGDLQLKAFERILGWKFYVSPPTKDSVKIEIDFGDSYYEE